MGLRILALSEGIMEICKRHSVYIVYDVNNEYNEYSVYREVLEHAPLVLPFVIISGDCGIN
jgi:hypothetical protein